jgi:hypothetical protein
MFPFFDAAPKGPTMRERVLRALQNEGPARGQLTIALRIVKPTASLAEFQEVFAALRTLVRDGSVLEKAADEWGAPSYVYEVGGKSK